MDDAGFARAIKGLIAENAAAAPTVPGLYRLPCGECFVDFFIGADGIERWLVPGDDAPYTRETVVIGRHGGHAWAKMYRLEEAASHLKTLAASEGVSVDTVVNRFANN